MSEQPNASPVKEIPSVHLSPGTIPTDTQIEVMVNEVAARGAFTVMADENAPEVARAIAMRMLYAHFRHLLDSSSDAAAAVRKCVINRGVFSEEDVAPLIVKYKRSPVALMHEYPIIDPVWQHFIREMLLMCRAASKKSHGDTSHQK